MTKYPTAEQVARIVVAACAETGVSPLDVLSGARDAYRNNHTDTPVYPISRARVYAAVAINEMFGCGRACSSRMCGVSKKSEAAHTAIVYGGAVKWFSLDVLRRVASEIDPERAARIELSREYPRRDVVLSSTPPCEYDVDDRIEHLSYGRGVVADVGAYNHKRRDYPLSIRFDSGHFQVMYARVVQAAQKQTQESRSDGGTTRATTVALRRAVRTSAVEPAPVPTAPVSRRPMPPEFRTPLTMRKMPVPAHLCEDQTADLMGDPPPGRSAFSQHAAETYAAIERETRAELRGER